MEVGDGFSQCFRNVGKHSLKVSESLSCIIGIFRIDSLVRFGTRNKYHDTPVAFSVEPVSFSFFSGEERENLAVDVSFSGFGQFLANMSGDCGNIGLKHFYILEDSMVDALQNVVGGVCFLCVNFVCVVDKSCSQRLNLCDSTLGVELGYNT